LAPVQEPPLAALLHPNHSEPKKQEPLPGRLCSARSPAQGLAELLPAAPQCWPVADPVFCNRRQAAGLPERTVETLRTLG